MSYSIVLVLLSYFRGEVVLCGNTPNELEKLWLNDHGSCFYWFDCSHDDPMIMREVRPEFESARNV